jgi:hypothetical protein
LFLAVAACAALLPALFVANAQAASVLDQSQTNLTGFSGANFTSFGTAQTFTDGITGTLDHIELYLNGSPDIPLVVDIKDTTLAGSPGADVLGSATLPAGSVPQAGEWATVTFSPAPAVSAGQLFAITLLAGPGSTSQSWIWSGSASSTYSSGAPWFTHDSGATWSSLDSNGTTDFAFKTFVTPTDVTAPTITLTTPKDGATYAQNQPVLAAYSCQDETGGSGVSSCDGFNGGVYVGNGAAIDTTTLGTHTFTVNATDNAGNPASVSHQYTVVSPYNFTGLFSTVSNPGPNNNVFKKANAGSSFPFKLSL